MVDQISHRRTAPIDCAKEATSSCLQQYLLTRLSSLHACSEDRDEALRAAAAFISALQPKDAIEEVLAAGMVVALEVKVSCFSKAAAAGDNSGIRNLELRNAERFSKLFSQSLHAFEKRRHRLKIDRLLTNTPLAQALPW